VRRALPVVRDDVMQTFLPYADFERSAAVLDPRRLGKQRVEVVQIVRALTVPTYAWKTHPAALGAYGLAIVDRWCELGFGDTCAATLRTDLAAAGVPTIRSQSQLAGADAQPPWLGDERLHRTHRSALLRKDPDFYRPLFPDVPDDLEYWWPRRSPKVIEAEQRQRAAQAARKSRAAAKALTEREKASRRRSTAAKKAARTRARNRSNASSTGAGASRGPSSGSITSPDDITAETRERRGEHPDQR